MATDWSAGTPWDTSRKNPRGNIVDRELDWQDFSRDDIVGQELNRPSSAFSKVQRYPEGYGSGSAPSGPSGSGRPGGFGGGGGFGNFAGGSFTFNPTFNVTSSNVNTAGGGGGAIGSITDSTVGDIETGADTTTKGPIKTTSAESGTTAANTFLEDITDSVISDTANPIQTPIVTASNQAPSSIAAALTNQTQDTSTNQNIPDNLGTITNTGQTESTTTQTAENTATSEQEINEYDNFVNESEQNFPIDTGTGGEETANGVTDTGTGTGTGGEGTGGEDTGGGTTVTNIHVDPLKTKIEQPEPKVPNTDTSTGPDEGSSGTPELIDKYNLILGRGPDEEGLQYWEDELATRTAAGEDRGDVLDNITESFQAGDEFLNRQLAQQLDNQIVPDEDRLDAWIGPGGGLTQSSDPEGLTYYEGVGSLEDYIDPDTEGAADQSTSDIFGLFQEKFDRNPDESGLQYWEDELATRTAAGEEYEDVLANIGQSFDESAEAELRDTISSGQDLSATQDINAFNEDAPELQPGDPFYVDPNFDWDAEVAKVQAGLAENPNYFEDQMAAMAIDPSNPFAEQNAQLQQQQEQEQEQEQELVPYYDVDFSDPSSYMGKEIDWSANWTQDTDFLGGEPWYKKQWN